MTPGDLAALHAACFTTPRPWTGAEFTDLLAAPACFLLAGPRGFLLGRVIADEAELLTLAVDPQARRAGLGRALVTRFAAAAQARGARSAFLEVSEANAPARALYAACGWQAAGRRRGYYHPPAGPPEDALILTLDLAAAGRRPTGELC